MSEAPPTPPPSVAVIGMAGRFPGAADVDEFWQNLRAGRESISTFSVEEMVASGVDRREAEAPEYVAARGVAQDLDGFDATFFGYTPREAELMDPQHRIFLECAWEALESCGIVPEEYEGAIGVYGGSSISTYLINNVAPAMGGLGAGAIQAVLANDKDHVPTRVSYKLNLRGPSVNVQTACSTSLVATHLACQSLLSGECDVALAGGASVTVPLRAGYRFAEGSILSPDGHCRAFDEAAAGTVGGSGVAMVVLKRLEDAIEDGDPVRAVIRGSAINNDGSFKVGYAAPSVDGQAEVIAQAQAIADVEPATVTYVEAHGTATQLGDPIEITALTRAFRERTDRSGFCAIGSVKTNIGHMDAAAGVAGLIKAVLAVEHGEIPPSLHYTAPNPQIEFESTPFYVSASLEPWVTDGVPRRAGVSSFGIGGTNAHVVVEEPPDLPEAAPSKPPHLLVFSARNASALADSASRLADHLERHSEASLADTAYTLAVGRRAFSRRASVVAADRASAVARLRAVAALDDSGTTAVRGRPVAFMFPGQGSQHPNMGRDLYEDDPGFRHDMDACFEAARPFLDHDLREVVYPADPASEEVRRRLTDTRYAQPALFAIQYSLSRLWGRWGVRPDSMIGHSIGEYAAACVAGVFDFEDAMRLVAARGRLMAAQPSGSMLAVPLAVEEVRGWLEEGVSVAAVNQPGLTVVSGPDGAIDSLADRLKAEGLEARRLHTSHAFHSAMMDPALAPFQAEVADVARTAPEIPFISCVTGRQVLPDDATDPAYWARHLRDPVLFADGLEALLDGLEDPIFLEVGPSQTLSALSRRNRRASVVIPTLPHARSDDDVVETVLGAAGKLWEAGGPLDWPAMLGAEGRRRIPLPSYPFQRVRYWMEPADSRPSRAPLDPDAKLPIREWLYVPTWRQTPRSRPVQAGELPGRWMILGSETPLGRRLASVVEELGAEVTRVRAGEEYGLDDGGYSLEPGSPDGYSALLRDLGHVPEVVVHAWSSPPPGSEETDRGLYPLLWFGRALAEASAGDDVRVAVVASSMVDGPGAETPDPDRAAMVGVARVLPQELSRVTTVCVDVEPDVGDRGRDDDLRRLLGDMTAVDPEQVVALRRGRRFVEAFEAVDPPAPEAGTILRPDGAYMVLGGLGGVGLELAGHLFDLCGARLALTTRRPVRQGDDGRWRLEDGDSAPAPLAALQDAGAEVLLLQCDVTDAASVEAAFDAAESAYGGLDGVVFAVGAGKDPSALDELERGDVEEQLRVRAEGLRAVASAVEGRPVDFCLVQSSLSSVLGAPGFVGYAAAHAFMDAFAAVRDAESGVRWLVVDWDNWITWKDEGSAVEGAIDFFIARDEGRQAVAAVLAAAAGEPRVVVSTGSLEARRERWINPGSGGASDDASPDSSRYARPETGTAYAAPRNETESKLAEIWGEVLGIDAVGVDDDFFELGGDSVLGIQVVAKARKAGFHFSAEQIFDLPTVALMAEAAGKGEAPPEAEQEPVTGPVEPTPIQRWFFDQEFDPPDHFNMPVLLERGDVDVETLREALEALARHHDMLRARWIRGEDGWTQRIEGPEETIPVDVVDLSDVAEDGLAEELEGSASRFQAGLDLAAGPLVRAVVFRTPGRGPDRILLVVHHLVVDAVSWRILVDDLQTAYEQLRSGRGVELPPKTTSFATWSDALAAYVASGAVDHQADSWEAHALAPVEPLPRDRDEGSNDMASARSVKVRLSEGDTRALLQMGPRARARVDEVLLAALAASVSGWTGRPEVRFAMEGHGREAVVPDVDVSRTVGWFTALHPLRLVVDEPDSWRAALHAVKESRRSLPHGGMGYGLLRYLGDAPALDDAPEPEISFLYLGRYGTSTEGSEGFRVLREPAGDVCSPAMERPRLIDVLCMVVDGALHVELGYSANRHDEATIRALADAFVTAVRELLADAAGGPSVAPVASDFPEAGLTQEQLDSLIAGMQDKGE